MAYYGYDPSQYVKSYAGVAQAGSMLGQGIMSAAEIAAKQAESDKKIQAAIDAANANWPDVELVYSGAKESLIKNAKAAGMSEDAAKDLVNSKFQVPRRGEFNTDPKKMFARLHESFWNIQETIDGIAKKRDEGATAQTLGANVAESAERAALPGVKETGVQPTEVSPMGIKKYEPTFEQTSPAPTTKQQYSTRLGEELGKFGAGTQAEAAGIKPMETAAVTSRMGGLPEEPKPMTELQKEELSLKKIKAEKEMADKSGEDYYKKKNLELKQMELKLKTGKVLQEDINRLRKEEATWNTHLDKLTKELKELQSPPKVINEVTRKQEPQPVDWDAVEAKRKEIINVQSLITNIDNNILSKIPKGTTYSSLTGEFTPAESPAETDEQTKLYQALAEAQELLEKAKRGEQTKYTVEQLNKAIQDINTKLGGLQR